MTHRAHHSTEVSLEPFTIQSPVFYVFKLQFHLHLPPSDRLPLVRATHITNKTGESYLLLTIPQYEYA